MKDIFAQRLKGARLLRSMSQDKLVRAMDRMVSKNAISKYERGEMMPNSKVLLALAKALEVKPDYFFRAFAVKIEKIEFRKRSRLLVSREKAIKQMVIDQIERYLEIEKFLDIPNRFSNPVAMRIIQTQDDVEQSVSILLEKWNLGINALPNIIEVLEDRGVKIIEIDAEDTFDGLSGWVDDRIPILVVNRSFSIERKRFTVLHELAHLILHFAESLDHKSIEKLCNYFAGAVLIPKQTFFMQLGDKRNYISLNELVSIKETYGISVQAIMARAHALDVINRNSYVRFCIQARTNKKEEGWGTYLGREESDRFEQLVYRAAAEEVISMSKAANMVNKKLALFREEFVAL